MVLFVKSVRKVLDVDIKSPNEGNISLTTEYERFLKAKNADNVFETSMGDFEKNGLNYNANYLIYNDDNPLVYGLKNLDRFAMVIANKSYDGVMTFVNKPFFSTPFNFKSASLAEATDIALQNLGMFEAVKSGVQKSLPIATSFNALCLTIVKEIKRGHKVSDVYGEVVFKLGKEAITEWAYNGS